MVVLLLTPIAILAAMYNVPAAALGVVGGVAGSGYFAWKGLLGSTPTTVFMLILGFVFLTSAMLFGVFAWNRDPVSALMGYRPPGVLPAMGWMFATLGICSFTAYAIRRSSRRGA